MRGIRIILIMAAVLGLVLIAGTVSANAATAKPAVAHAVPAGQITYGMAAANTGSFLTVSESGYPYVIYPTGVQIRSATVGANTGALDVCLEWDNPSAILYLKIFDPAGNPVQFELADGRVVSEVSDADDGVIDHRLHFIIANGDGSNLSTGDWYYEVRSDVRSMTTNYRI